MLLSRYRSERDNAPTVADLDWQGLAQLLTTHNFTPCTVNEFPGDGFDVCTGKDCAHKSGAAWSPAIMRPCPPRCHMHGGKSDCGGGKFHRLNANVAAVHAAVFDLDHLPHARLLACAERLEAVGIAYILHSTHSHAPPDDCCLRLVLPLSRPVTAAEYAVLRRVVIARFDLPADPKTKDAARLYYLPSAPSDADVIAESSEGGALAVDHLLAEAPALAPAPPVSPVAAPGESAPAPEGPVDLEALRDRLRAVTKPESREIALRILKGEPLAEQGARDDTLNRAVSLCATALPVETPDAAILELLRPSVLAMPGEPPPGDSDWLRLAAYKLERARVRRVENDRRRDEFNAAVRARLCRDSAAVDDPAEPAPATADGEPAEAAEAVGAMYTAEQLERWINDQGCKAYEEFDRRWIIQRGRAFYVFVGGAYRAPITRDDLEVSLPRDLARAPIELQKLTKEGNPRPAKVAEILRDHATVARDTQASLALQRSFYDPASQTFFEAVRPLRRIRPVEHPMIHMWLELLGGDQSARLLDWVATVGRLDRQACAIYFDGAGGTGKNLFAGGLARLWTTGGPTELSRVLGGFNDSLINCPLLFADEALPQVKGITAELRRLIGSTQRTLRRLYLPACSLDGAVRVILAGNNDRLLDTGEDLSSNDLDAVAGRFLYVRPNPEAREYLLDVGGPPVVGRWISEDMLAEHALYLQATRKVNEGARFLVEGEAQEFHSHLATGSGIAGLVCEWIVRYLADPNTARQGAPGRPLVLVGAGEVWVATEALAGEAGWHTRVPSTNVPSATKIGRALRNLAVGKERVKVGDAQITYWRVRPELLLSWSERAQVGDVESLRARIAGACTEITEAKRRRGEK